MSCHLQGDIGCWLDVAGEDIAEKYGTRDQAEVQSKLVLNVLVADLLCPTSESAEKQMGEVRLAADVGETHDSQELDGYEHTSQYRVMFRRDCRRREGREMQAGGRGGKSDWRARSRPHRARAPSPGSSRDGIGRCRKLDDLQDLHGHKIQHGRETQFATFEWA